MSHNKDIACSRRTLYKYINLGVFTARNIDLPRKIKYKVRKPNKTRKTVNYAYLKERSYNDFLTLLKENPSLMVVEMDVVEGHNIKVVRWW